MQHPKELLFVWVSWLDLPDVLSEVVDVLVEGFHVLVGLLERFRLHFGCDLILIAGASTASELHCE